ncbi:MAG TPA: MBL fold metallo-hydrolase [Clostridia bacterium]|nr:MBL fold metallo-hydrolase [Clostridia bacterium]
MHEVCKNRIFIASINKLRYIANTSFVVISKQGTVVVIDPFSVDPEINPDLIIVTHRHYDHYNENFINSRECLKSIALTGSFTFRDVKVTGIAASHNGDTIDKENPDNVIYVIEIDGLRIAHFGDTGQSRLTQEQLDSIGTLDIAMMQFINPNSGFTVSNKKGLEILRQVDPSIVLPTHAFGIRNAHIGKKWFILPTHGVGKTLRSLEREWAPVIKKDYLSIDDPVFEEKHSVIWFGKTVGWKEIISERNC